jgi:plastocyanin
MGFDDTFEEGAEMMDGRVGGWARFSLMVCAALAMGCGGGADSGGKAPRSVTIDVRGFAYEPAASPLSAEIAVGDTVIWKNDDVVPHTATADTGEFDSGSIAAGGSWVYVATRSGSIAYHCAFHPTMKGMLVVR